MLEKTSSGSKSTISPCVGTPWFILLSAVYVLLRGFFSGEKPLHLCLHDCPQASGFWSESFFLIAIPAFFPVVLNMLLFLRVCFDKIRPLTIYITEGHCVQSIGGSSHISVSVKGQTYTFPVKCIPELHEIVLLMVWILCLEIKYITIHSFCNRH